MPKTPQLQFKEAWEFLCDAKKTFEASATKRQFHSWWSSLVPQFGIGATYVGLRRMAEGSTHFRPDLTEARVWCAKAAKDLRAVNVRPAPMLSHPGIGDIPGNVVIDMLNATDKCGEKMLYEDDIAIIDKGMSGGPLSDLEEKAFRLHKRNFHRYGDEFNQHLQQREIQNEPDSAKVPGPIDPSKIPF